MSEKSGLFWRHLNNLLSQRCWTMAGVRRRTRAKQSQLRNHSAQVELLEIRALLSGAGSLVAVPTVQIEHSHATTAANSGYSPGQLQTAYGFNQVSIASGANGTGQTIAIVDAYNDPNIQNDLKAFDAAFGLANPPSLTVMSQTGSTTSLPSTDPSAKPDDWELEEALDVEWAHALAPGARIILVEANSANYSDLMTAVRTAASQPGVSVVSMSWGGGEFSGESSYDSYFTTPAGHQGVTFVASTGDSGAPGGFPAYSSNVVAIGGTSLTIGSSGNYVSESGWSSGGGGISQYESQPAYQKGIVTQTTTQRAIPDVSFVADPNTGVAVYDSYSFGTASPWAQIGGTSLSAPSWASIISIVDQARVQNGLGTLDGASQTLPMLYKLDQTTPSAFHDITTGNNGFAAGVGYDLVTGLGTPVVNTLVTGLAGQSTTSSATKLAIQQSPVTGTAGVALSPPLTIVVENSSGQIVTTDSSTVTLTIASGPGSFAGSSTVSAKAVNGVATFSNLVLNTAGSYTISASDTGLSGSTTGTITINAAAAAKVVFQQGPTTGTAGKALNSVTVAVEDQFGNIVTGNSSTVTISVASGPGSFATGSTTSVVAVKGIATFTNLVLGTAGSYSLSASDTGLTGATSSSFTVNSSTTTLSAPQNVTLVALTTTTAQLSWSGVTGAQGYRVYQVVGTQSTLAGTVTSSTTSVQLTGLTAGSTVSFKVEAYSGTVIADSAVVSVTMPTGTTSPLVLTDTVLSSSSVQLNWNAISGVQSYRLYYTIGTHQYSLGSERRNTTSVQVVGLVAGTSYQFMVEAVTSTTVVNSNWVTVVTSNTSTNSQHHSSANSENAPPAGAAFSNDGTIRH